MIEFPSEAIARNKELDAAVLMDFQSVAGSVILSVPVSLGDSKPPAGAERSVFVLPRRTSPGTVLGKQINLCC